MMKTSIRLTMLVCLVAFFMTARAANSESDVALTFNKFVAKLTDMGWVTSSETNEYSNGYMHTYSFSLPGKKVKQLEDYERKMTAYSPLAYSSCMRRAGSGGSAVNIGFGENSSRTLSTCTRKDRNYNVLLLRDSRDSTMRYAYVLYWQPVKGKDIQGAVTRIYGKDPARMPTKSKNMSSLKDGLSSLEDGLSSLKDLVKVEYKNDSTIVYIRTDKKKPLNILNKLAMDSLKTSTDVVVMLNKLCSMMVNTLNTTEPNLVLVLNGKIVNVCYNYGKLLTKDDRENCIKLLKHTKELIEDKTEEMVIETAIKMLNGKIPIKP